MRFRYWLKKLKTRKFKSPRRRPSIPYQPPLQIRIRYYLHQKRKQYAVVFSSKYLIIALNSTVIYLLSFFLVHFLTHFVTGLAALFCKISTTLNYTFVDFHIRYYNWTEEMVIQVFSIPALFALLISFLTLLPFAKGLKWPDFLKRLPHFTKKQRYKHKYRQRQKVLEHQVRRLNKTLQPYETPKVRKRLSWQLRLFFLWTFYHCMTYFFSGMLYSFLFHRRVGYVIWYAFNSYIFDVLFSALAFLSLAAIGHFIAVQFFNSARMYLNDLNGRNRMPFVISQAIFPFVIGTIVTILFQIPVFDPALVLLNFSIFFLLLPLPSRAVRYDNLHFDRREKAVKIYWHWVALSSVIIISIMIALKSGIQIRAL